MVQKWRGEAQEGMKKQSKRIPGVAEAKRQELNTRIDGNGAYDAVINFDAALSAPEDPSIIRTALSADGLHPNANGYQTMTDTAYAAIRQMLPDKNTKWIAIVAPARHGRPALLSKLHCSLLTLFPYPAAGNFSNILPRFLPS